MAWKRRGSAVGLNCRFSVDLEADTVICPNQVTVTIGRGTDGSGIAYFAGAHNECALREACTKAVGATSTPPRPDDMTPTCRHHPSNDPRSTPST